MKLGNRKGFSLIEIGIVMVVIGLIIAAVMKGKDVIKNAETKEVSQTYMAKWVNFADTYYDKMGYNFFGTPNNKMLLGGTAVAPNLAVIGLEEVNGKSSAVPNLSVFDLSVDTISPRSTTMDIIQELEAAGINPNKAIKTNTDNVNTRVLSGEFTDEVEITMSMGYIDVTDATNVALFRSVLVFHNVPVDVAKSFDKLIDAAVDGTRGKVLTDGIVIDHVSTATMGATEVGRTALTAVEWAATRNALSEEGQLTNVYVVLDH